MTTLNSSLRFSSSNIQESPSDVLSKILRSVRVSLGMEVAFISELKLGRRIFRYVDNKEGFAPVEVGGSNPAEESYCQRVIDGRLPELIPDAQLNCEAMTLDATSSLPVGAHMSIPIVFSDNTTFGTFCCFSRDADESLCDRDLELMRFIASCTAHLLEETVTNERQFELRNQQIKNAIYKNQLYMVFQPIYGLETHSIVGFEALARFNVEPYRSPDQWFSQAEEVGLDVDLEIIAIEKAISYLDKLPSESLYISVNISPTTVLKASSKLEEILGSHCERIMLEITEHTAIDDYIILHNLLEPLRHKGMKLAVDDTGAGYASFRHIIQLQPDMIKLDRSLVSGIDKCQDSRALARALITFAEDTNTSVVAEGIETNEELATLISLGVKNGQGYLLGRPTTIEHFL